MGRWTQYEEDASRLPEGFTRVAYDADTRRYRFKDRHGKLYQSEPGESYGTLTPLEDPSIHVEKERPGAFEDPARKRPTPTISPISIKTFQDFVPADLIATSPTSPSHPHHHSLSPTKSTSRDQFVSAVRRTALPKMHGVVTGLRRSMTSARKHHTAAVEEERGLLRKDSVASSVATTRTSAQLDRMGSMRSDVSTVKRMSVESPKR